MGTPSFLEFKKQASFFFKEKIKTARLALTDVTPTELRVSHFFDNYFDYTLICFISKTCFRICNINIFPMYDSFTLCRMTEEATSGNPWAPNTPTLRSISKAAFELDDYWRIVEILHKRFVKFEKKNWRASYNSLIVLEHLLTHGPKSVADEFQSDKDFISQLIGFQYIDEKGFNWGLTVRKKSERVLKLLEEGNLLKEERNNARRLSRGIQGFGSFPQKSIPTQGVLREKSLPITLRRCDSDSDSDNHEDQENKSSCTKKVVDTEAVKSAVQQGNFKIYQDDLDESQQQLHKSESSSKENMEPSKEEWELNGESKPLLDCGEEDSKPGIFRTEDDHPFNSTTEMHATSSLLLC